jgi:hypothetical protein
MTVTQRAQSLDAHSTSLGRLLVTLICCLIASAHAVAADSIHVTSTVPDATKRVQTLVDELRSRLHLHASVMAAIVPENPLLVSVAPPFDREGTYRLSFEARFLDQLSDDDLRAVVAHELGHVWIFTHHPYLQTEALANEVAQQVVTRESLERVYARLWDEGTPRGTIARFAGGR